MPMKTTEARIMDIHVYGAVESRVGMNDEGVRSQKKKAGGPS